MAKVVVTQRAHEQLEKLPLRIQGRFEDIIDRLERWPSVSGVKPLRGRLKGAFRLRTGDYRVIFVVEADTVTVTDVGDRKDVYED